MNRAVFLDRDGVINVGVVRDGKPFAPLTLDEFQIAPGVPQALANLKAAGFLLIVVTNQPDISRGLGRRDQVDAIHAHMRQVLPIDDVFVCFHDDKDLCACRKPLPGLIYAAAVRHEVQIARSYMVGDRWRDIGAGKNAGCASILVNAFPEEKRIDPDVELADLLEASRWILLRQNVSKRS
jgi:D-glycero-D-manno-heptose 1,7-bisphosphate phosphatase